MKAKRVVFCGFETLKKILSLAWTCQSSTVIPPTTVEGLPHPSAAGLSLGAETDRKRPVPGSTTHALLQPPAVATGRGVSTWGSGCCHRGLECSPEQPQLPDGSGQTDAITTW